MSNTGKGLENLVAEIEQVFRQPGSLVERREKIHDENGVQIAEFDIVIESEEDDKTTRLLIECRDRPRSGSAPGGWIEQLGGRKVNHGFDRVMAVSTTGFSPGALRAAGNLDVDLAEVQNMDLESIQSWMCVENFEYRKRITQCTYVRAIHDTDLDLESVEALKEAVSGITAHDKIFLYEQSSQVFSASEILRNVVHSENPHPDLEEGEKRTIQVVVKKEDRGEEFYIETGQGLIEIPEIRMAGNIRLEVAKIEPDIVTVYELVGGLRSIETVRFPFELGGQNYELRFHRSEEDEQITVTAGPVIELGQQ